ncbi:MAG: response regulator transcription factor, partial [Comamonadaceae bacterium]
MTRAHTAPPGPSAQAGPATALRVLVVDDHPRIREPLAQFLRREGVQAQTAADVRSMLGALALAPFDAVVLDVMLPDGNGSLICAQVRQEFGVPVILLTAQADVDDRVRGLERGADDYVIKPFDPRELLARIRNVVRRHPGPAGPARTTAVGHSPQPPQRAYR